MNSSNLISFDAMTAERHRELSRKGGTASGIARRAKRERIEAAKARIIAEKEMQGNEFYMLHKDVRALVKLFRNER